METYPKISKFIMVTLTIITSIVHSSCKKFIEVKAPISSINQENVFRNNSYAISAVTGIYAKMSSTGFTLNQSLYPELSADNLALFDLNNTSAIQYYQNSLNSTYANDPIILWNDLYSYVYSTNAYIEGLTKSTGLSEIVQSRLLGETYFLRGFLYFYLVNLFKNVPLVLTTDYTQTSILGNTAPDLIYLQITKDLTEAKKLLDNSYLDGTLVKPTEDRVRPTQMAASALLARVYLYMKNYPKAEEEASLVINHNDLFDLPSLNEVFLKNSKETIWSLQPVGYSLNTNEGSFFIYSDGGPDTQSYTYLSDDLLKQFEKGDLRKTVWVGYFQGANKIYPFAYKYKVKNGEPETAVEYPIVLRLAEQYLIRSEARLYQGKIGEGINDLNKLRGRARDQITPDVPNPLPDLLLSMNSEEAIDALAKERRIELFTEWGNRWFDLKRTGKIDEVMSIASQSKQSTWKPYQADYPIPAIEVSNNVNLKQNPGYK